MCDVMRRAVADKAGLTMCAMAGLIQERGSGKDKRYATRNLRNSSTVLWSAKLGMTGVSQKLKLAKIPWMRLSVEG